ncbi:MAG: hypothetical protein VX727_07970 [Planctomycetota bacterium]|nr:hypothetical protein [Planctomycetota bacterium]|tara:strand:- start:9037 stop:9534 length:498 start_codon:yes stop_codon:yes gene_type:complete
MTYAPRNARHGVVLLEVIVAAIVLALGMTVVISLSTQSMSRQIQGERRMTAAWLADELLSMVVVEGPRNFANAEPMGWIGEDARDGYFPPPFDDYSYELDLEAVGDYQPYMVTATVKWMDGVRQKSLAINTRIAPRQGEEEEELPREPIEPLDRESRYYDEDEES